MEPARAPSYRLRAGERVLGYLSDRNFSPHTVRACAYDLLAFARWLLEVDIALGDVDVDAMLRFLTACRRTTGDRYTLHQRRGGTRRQQPAAATLQTTGMHRVGADLAEFPK
jgi:hypothetical protein